MATAEQQRSTDIQVENPATGEVIGSVATVSVEELHAMAERGRAAQPAWEALGFDGRAKILRRAQKWTTDNAERIARTIVGGGGQGLRGRAAGRGRLRGQRVRLLGQARARVPG